MTRGGRQERPGEGHLQRDKERGTMRHSSHFTQIAKNSPGGPFACPANSLSTKKLPGDLLLAETGNMV